MNEYRTVNGYGRGQIEEKRSVFIGSADFVTTEEEAVAFISRIREEFPDARHNVYAYLLREGAKTRYSDDKEPQGTAGMPVLEVLRKNECFDTVVVVTRYFGGILLGAGGLARAYTEAATVALEAAGRVLRRPCIRYGFRCSYNEFQRCSRLLEQCGALMDEPTFGADVEVTYTIPSREAEGVSHQLSELTNGRLCPKILGETWQKVPF